MWPVQQGANLSQAQHAQRTKCCFTCRTTVSGRPLPNYAVKHLLDAVRPHLDVEAVADGTIKPEVVPPTDMWDQAFRENQEPVRRWFHDFEDGVRRCGHCGHEVADGACSNCGDVFSDLESEMSLGFGSEDGSSQASVGHIVRNLRRAYEEEQDGGSVFSNDASDEQEEEEPRFRYFNRRAQSPRVRWVGNNGENLLPTDDEQSDRDGSHDWNNGSDIGGGDNHSDLAMNLSGAEDSDYDGNSFIDDGPQEDDQALGGHITFDDDEEVEWMPNLAVDSQPPRVREAGRLLRRRYVPRVNSQAALIADRPFAEQPGRPPDRRP